MTVHHPTLGRAAAVIALSSTLVACESSPTKPRPKPTAAAKAGACTGQAKLADPANAQYLPAKIESYCLDPEGSDRSYGEGAKAPIDGICDVFDGDCEIYKQHDVRRVVEIRYVDGTGSPATIDVYLSKFASRDKAYAMFTKRVVGDGDPAHPDAHRPVAGGGRAALGIGNAYLWRGQFLVEITLNDETASTKALRKRADALLPKLVAQMGSSLPGSTKPPAAVAALPTDEMLPLGIRYVTADALGIKGTGPGAVGYYRDENLRWRLLSIACRDEDQASDVLSTFGRTAGATEEEAVGDGGVRLMQQTGPGAPQAEWVIARKGKALLGLGDEFLVLRDGMTANEHRAKTLSQDQKREKLRALLEPEKPAKKK